ncbi:MAG: hypothetical protein H7A33_07360 [Deltaproteobacteria bacterium]|nr:hypothetical protein [Deltaproteobacteria bacterium]
MKNKIEFHRKKPVTITLIPVRGQICCVISVALAHLSDNWDEKIATVTCKIPNTQRAWSVHSDFETSFTSRTMMLL